MFKLKNKLPYIKTIKKIRDFESEIQNLSQEQLVQIIQEIKKEKNLEKKKISSYGVMSQAIKKVLGISIYDVQLSGALALSDGNIAQMKTGEGKTITALFPALYASLEGKKTYVITVNEYLAERDYLQAKEVFDYLNIEIGLILKDYDISRKKKNYATDIIYITNTEFAFDYLRDNICKNSKQLMQGNFDFAIIDEADLVLIDEAKNPVIISGNQYDNSYYFQAAHRFVSKLTEDDYEINEDTLVGDLTDMGYDKALKTFGYEVTDNPNMYQAIKQTLLAQFKLNKDVDYIVRNNEVLIVDKYTGRVLSGRRFQDGLHQALEVKENVEIQTENTPLAITTYQNLFKKFKILSGMTGTAIESQKEFVNIYQTNVLNIPTNKPVIRIDKEDILFKSKFDKYQYLIELVKERNKKGQPILIGTTSVKDSEEIVSYLYSEGMSFQLLNAKNDKEESLVISKAGELGAITVSTNMAGRGTDIKISKEVESLGGLLVIGVSRNESKRIDIQLRGRSGRQGEPGESIFLTSIEDELVKNNSNSFIQDKIDDISNYPVIGTAATKLIDLVQRSIESTHIGIRDIQYKLDEILNYQREFVYKIRKDILLKDFVYKEHLYELEKFLPELFAPFFKNGNYPENWKLEELSIEIKKAFNLNIDFVNRDDYTSLSKKQITYIVLDSILEYICKLEAQISSNKLNNIIKDNIINSLDNFWILYLQEAEVFKLNFNFMSLAEQDPIRAYSIALNETFKNLLKEFKLEFLTNVIIDLENYGKEKVDKFPTFYPKEQYRFKINLNLKEMQPIKVCLESNSKILTEFISQGKDFIFVDIKSNLDEGTYIIKTFSNEKELGSFKFKISKNGKISLSEDLSLLKIELPTNDLAKSDILEGLIIKDNEIVSKFPINGSKPIVLKKENKNWELGNYNLMVINGSESIYSHDFSI